MAHLLFNECVIFIFTRGVETFMTVIFQLFSNIEMHLCLGYIRIHYTSF